MIHIIYIFSQIDFPAFMVLVELKNGGGKASNLLPNSPTPHWDQWPRVIFGPKCPGFSKKGISPAGSANADYKDCGLAGI